MSRDDDIQNLRKATDDLGRALREAIAPLIVGLARGLNWISRRLS